jgi:hypothetical protein
MAPYKRKKAHSMQWIDSHSRFLARVSNVQDCPPFVRMEVRIPEESHDMHRGVDLHESVLENNLYIELEEVLVMRPYLPHNAMLAVNPTLYEVTVFVDNFWCIKESGGNSGRPVRKGTIYVRGETEMLRRLRGEKDTRFTAKGKSRGGRTATRTNADASGVRGLTQKLQGDISIRRMRTKELQSGESFESRWVCIDYTATHKFHCKAEPRCVLRQGKQSACMNPSCFNRPDLYLVRDKDNEYDKNAIAIVCRTSGLIQVVGFVPKELACCLAPAMDTFSVMTDTDGIYSDVPSKGDARHKVWFRVDGRSTGNGGPDDYLVNEKLGAIPWWTIDTSSNAKV